MKLLNIPLVCLVWLVVNVLHAYTGHRWAAMDRNDLVGLLSFVDDTSSH